MSATSQRRDFRRVLDSRHLRPVWTRARALRGRIRLVGSVRGYFDTSLRRASLKSGPRRAAPPLYRTRRHHAVPRRISVGYRATQVTSVGSGSTTQRNVVPITSAVEATLSTLLSTVHNLAGAAVIRQPAGDDAVVARVGRVPWLYDPRLTTGRLRDDVLPDRVAILDWPVPFQAKSVGAPPRLLIARLVAQDKTVGVLLGTVLGRESFSREARAALDHTCALIQSMLREPMATPVGGAQKPAEPSPDARPDNEPSSETGSRLAPPLVPSAPKIETRSAPEPEPTGSSPSHLVGNDEASPLGLSVPALAGAPTPYAEPVPAESSASAMAANAASGTVIEAAFADNASGATEDRLAAEFAMRRAQELERLDAELQVRRVELERMLEREHAESEARIGAAERLEGEAVERRRDELNRWIERWAAEQPRLFAEHIGAAISAELSTLKQRRQEAEVMLRAEVELRRREEATRLESWASSERERIAAELRSEEERFHERLLRQLKEFESQLAERIRKQDETLARWWDEAEKVARQRVAALLQETLAREELTRRTAPQESSRKP